MNDDAKKPKREPAFDNLLNHLREELARTNEFSSAILDKVCKFKDVRGERPDTNPEEYPSGLLSDLRKCITDLADYNNILVTVKNGLEEVVG